LQPREAAIADLERSTATCPASAHLRKLGVVAPLLGVTLTALSFIFNADGISALVTVPQPPIEPGDASGVGEDGVASRAQLIRDGIVPLFMGVMLGAVLAIVNQLLQSRLMRSEDEILTASASPALAHYFRNPDSAFDRFADGIRESTELLSDAAKHLEAMLKRSGDGMETLSEGTHGLAAELSASAQALRDSVEIPARELVVAAQAMRNSALAVSSEFEDGFVQLGRRGVTLQQLLEEIASRNAMATDRHGGAIDALQASVRELTLATTEMRASLSGIVGAVDRLEAKSASDLRESLRALGDSARRYNEAVERSAAVSTQQSASIGGVVQSLQAAADAIRQTSAGMQEASRARWWRGGARERP
jgi:methyl-accepting chemotaxis protein